MRVLIEEVRICGANFLPQWLEAKPTGEMRARLLEGVPGVLVANLNRVSGSHRCELHLAVPFHRDEPERCLVNGGADGKQAVILVDRCLASLELRGKFFACFDFKNNFATLL